MKSRRLAFIVAKITQRLLTYETAAPANGLDGEEATYSKIHFCRDHSATSRGHIQMTTSDGTPLVYRYLVKAFPKLVDMASSGGPDEDITGAIAIDSNAVAIVQFFGTGNNWVMRNASVKAHAAREKMFRSSGVSRKERGAYDKTIHYCFSSNSETYLTPQCDVSVGIGSNINGGNWEHSQLIYPDDTSGAFLALTGSHASEETTTAFTTISLPQLYLSSRGRVEEDSNLETDDVPMKHSILNKLLNPISTGTQDEVVDLARDEQDVPPYDLTEVAGDFSKPYELGRLMLGGSAGNTASCIIEVPFGITYIGHQLLNAADTIEQTLDLSFELLDVYKM